MLYRKIGGLHWITLGRLRFAFCIARGPYSPRPRRNRLAAAYWRGYREGESIATIDASIAASVKLLRERMGAD